MNSYQYRTQRGLHSSPGKRWITTSNTALQEVADQLEGTYDQPSRIKALKDRKLANTTTSIHFGNDSVNYSSNAKSNQHSGNFSLDERNAQTARIKQMKKDLTTTKFTLGDERPDYSSTSHEAMKVGETFRGMGKPQSNEDIKNAIKKSSIHFGQEKVDYSSTAHEGMRYQGNQNNFSKLKEEVKEMTATLRKHNFSFGDEKVAYESDYNAGYGSVPLEAYREGAEKKGKMKGIIEDSRAAHFQLGNDKPVYESNAHSAMAGVQGRSGADVRAGMDRAKAMKLALQKTSIVIGDEDGGNADEEADGRPSTRWSTTSGSALHDVAQRLKGTYNRAQSARALKERKLANTTTHIHFGNEKVGYMSDMKDTQARCSGKISLDERNAQTARIKQMKKDLTTTKFTLGDERPDYSSTSHEAMKVGETFRGMGKPQSNEDIKNAIKKSSIHFGQEKVDYSSTAHEGMRYQGNQNNFSKLKEEVKEMTATLRKHNFSFGDEKVAYESDYNAGYGSVPLEAYREGAEKKGKMKGIIEDSRAAHFQLGNDKPVYESNAHSAMTGIGGSGAADTLASIENARRMKLALQKTSIVIGDDEEYF